MISKFSIMCCWGSQGKVLRLYSFFFSKYLSQYFGVIDENFRILEMMTYVERAYDEYIMVCVREKDYLPKFSFEQFVEIRLFGFFCADDSFFGCGSVASVSSIYFEFGFLSACCE